MSIKRIAGIASFQGIKLPFAPVRVLRGENGERIIEGVSSFIDRAPEIPFGRIDGSGNYKLYSKDERIALAVEAQKKKDRAAKRAAKGKSPIQVREPKQVPNFEETASSQAPIQTVKRGGLWVQVGADNLSAHIESR